MSDGSSSNVTDIRTRLPVFQPPNDGASDASKELFRRLASVDNELHAFGYAIERGMLRDLQTARVIIEGARERLEKHWLAVMGLEQKHEKLRAKLHKARKKVKRLKRRARK